MWTVKQIVVMNGRRMHTLECTDCGFITHHRVSRSYTHIKCKRCGIIERNRITKGRHHGPGKLTRTFYGYFRNVARRRDIAFTVSIEELWNIALRQELRCALSGLPLLFPEYSTGCGNYRRDSSNASLDRIDSTKSYTVENVQWVHKIVNIMKNGLDQDEFVHLCHAIASRHVNLEPSDLKGMKLVRSKVQRLTGEDTCPIIPTRAPSP